MSLRTNIATLKARIPEGVVLVAVSKTKSVELIREAYEAGQRDFGENYVQELLIKQSQLPHDIRWHFIGHLQSNKVKQIVPFVHLIHGIDSVKLLKEVNKQAEKAGRMVSCLLQIHIAREESKFGFSYEECRAFLDSQEWKSMKQLNVCGFMAMASNTDNEDELRKEYAGLGEFFDHERIKHPELSILSCGMSGDYALAIESGSTMIRVGSALFGERDYQTKAGT
ncbi:MAG TPA: YggS family pyridoxal phosphate-dependent enzyme [Bacteroidia bacterium]|nr:YggS family pyridoxal phosphate-dependent enzyme [Bacteroidia bacterium]